MLLAFLNSSWFVPSSRLKIKACLPLAPHSPINTSPRRRLTLFYNNPLPWPRGPANNYCTMKMEPIRQYISEYIYVVKILLAIQLINRLKNQIKRNREEICRQSVAKIENLTKSALLLGAICWYVQRFSGSNWAYPPCCLRWRTFKKSSISSWKETATSRMHNLPWKLETTGSLFN